MQPPYLLGGTKNNLTVKGHLKVTGILTARHIQGGGTVEAGEVVCDTLEANTLPFYFTDDMVGQLFQLCLLLGIRLLR